MLAEPHNFDSSDVSKKIALVLLSDSVYLQFPGRRCVKLLEIPEKMMTPRIAAIASQYTNKVAEKILNFKEVFGAKLFSQSKDDPPTKRIMSIRDRPVSKSEFT